MNQLFAKAHQRGQNLTITPKAAAPPKLPPGIIEFQTYSGYEALRVNTQGGDEDTQIAGRGRSPLPRPPPPNPPGALEPGARAGASLFARTPGFLVQALGFRTANASLDAQIGDLRGLAGEGAFLGRNVAAFKIFVLERVLPPLGGARVIDSNLAVFNRPAADIGAFLIDANAFAMGQGVLSPSGSMISTTVIGPIRIAGPPPRL